MNVFRCDWCGRFYSSPLPDGSACDDHIPEHNERHARDIERFNSRLSPAVGRVTDVPTPDVEPRAGEPHQPAMTSLPSDPTQEQENRP